MSELLNKVRTLIRTRHYSYRTEQTYVHWIKQFILFHNKRHPAEMGAAEVTEFLSYLAVSRQVAASTAVDPARSPRADEVRVLLITALLIECSVSSKLD